MKDLPIVAKSVINIVLYIIYVLVASVIFSILFPLIMQVFGQDILDPSNPIFAKIQYFIAILVLLVSLILRKYFYISLKDEREVKVVVKSESYTTKKKQVNKDAHIKKKIEDDEDIKIYVEKEIK